MTIENIYFYLNSLRRASSSVSVSLWSSARKDAHRHEANVEQSAGQQHIRPSSQPHEHLFAAKTPSDDVLPSYPTWPSWLMQLSWIRRTVAHSAGRSRGCPRQFDGWGAHATILRHCLCGCFVESMTKSTVATSRYQSTWHGCRWRGWRVLEIHMLTPVRRKLVLCLLPAGTGAQAASDNMCGSSGVLYTASPIPRCKKYLNSKYSLQVNLLYNFAANVVYRIGHN